MDTNQILTIGIPTYNRPEHLQKCIRELLPYIDENIRVVIRDNASNFDISDLFTENELAKIHYQRNSINVGGDANILGLLTECTTKWCWLMGDDDYVNADAVSLVMESIRNHHDKTFINFCQKIDAETNGFVEFAEKFETIGVFGGSFFISSCVYNMELLKNSLYYYQEYVSSHIGQIIFVLKHLENHGGNCLLTKKELFKVHNGPSWNPIKVFMSASVIYYVFYKWRKQLRSSFFSGITNTYIHTIFLSGYNNSFNERLVAFKLLVAHYRFFNIIWYCRLKLLQVLAYSICPKSLYNKVYHSFSALLNN